MLIVAEKLKVSFKCVADGYERGVQLQASGSVTLHLITDDMRSPM